MKSLSHASSNKEMPSQWGKSRGPGTLNKGKGIFRAQNSHEKSRSVLTSQDIPEEESGEKFTKSRTQMRAFVWNSKGYQTTREGKFTLKANRLFG